MLKKVVSYFVPDAFHGAEVRYREARLFINTCLITALFSLSYISISLFIHFPPGIYSMLINVAVFSILPFLFKQGASLLFCSNIYAAVGAFSIYTVIYYSGGFSSPVLPWLASTPIVAMLIAGKKSGWTWAIISLIGITVFAILDITGYAFPIAYDTTFEKFFTISTHSGLVLIVFFISLVFEDGKHKALFKLNLRTEQVVRQKEQLEEKNKDITDSINYARKIQDAIMPPDAKVKQLFPQSFVLYLPKDIVSGDFYWCEQWGNSSLIVAADCTGHGVPGAFLSIVGSNLLNQCVYEHGITKPSIILNTINKGFSKMIHQKDKDSYMRDGMDISLCNIDHKTKKLQYAGAYNPLWLFRNEEIIELKGDKFPIGAASEQLESFNNHEIDLLEGDTIYIFSDGYADQFGGEKGKKFKYKQIQQLLLSLKNIPMEEQKEMLKKRIEEWKGNLEQVDDILMIGIRI